MYRCCECEKIFEEPKSVEEYRGEFWGTPAYESMDYSPCCEADFEEYEPRCKECGLCTKDKDGNYLCGWKDEETYPDDCCKDFELDEDKKVVDK